MTSGATTDPAHVALTNAVERLEDIAIRFAETRSLRPKQLLVLLDLDRADPPPTVGALAARFDVDASTMSRACDRLEARGLVARDTDPTDRRRVRIRLTADGQKVGRDFERLLRAAATATVDRMPVGTRATMTGAVAAFNRWVAAVS